MLERQLTLAEIMLIAGTRVALGVGIGLLLSNKLGHSERKAAGLALTLVGALTTVPIALNVLGEKRRCHHKRDQTGGIRRVSRNARKKSR